MKARTIVLLCAVAAASVWAQTAPPSQKVASDTKPAAGKPAATLAKPAPAKTAPVKAAPVKAAASPTQAKPAVSRAVKPVARKSPAKPAGAVVKKAAVKTAAVSKSQAARRDPFTSPIREQAAMGSGCSTGKKCLAIDAIVLRGIVRSQAGMIAVVESANRNRISYFLRENDPVFNGYVVRITPDTIIFRENVMDRLGKQSTRDVVMKVVAPVV